MAILFLALMVVLSRNPIYSVLLLILTVFCAASIMIILEAEYVAMITVIVYAGAIIILFLFLIMMFDINIESTKKLPNKIAPYVLVITFSFLGIFIYVLNKTKINIVEPIRNGDTELFKNSLQYIGGKIYTEYVFEFQVAGVILFLAMMGSIILVHRKHGKQVRKQNVVKQIMTDKHNSIELVNVKSRSGVKI